MQRDLRELGPTIGIAPPRIWENMLTSLRVRATDASPLKRKLFAFLPAPGRAGRAVAKSESKKPSLTMRLGLALGEFLVYGPVRDQLGLPPRPLGSIPAARRSVPDTFRFFRSFGVNLKQVWGATELSGLASLQPDGEANPDTVGPVVAGTEVRISDEGEVLIRSPAVFQGLLQAARGHPGRVDRGRLVSDRRLGLYRRAWASGHRRPCQGCRQARGRHHSLRRNSSRTS